MPTKHSPPAKLLPTGTCWCGCGSDTKRGSFFASGHDKRAEAAVILEEYGDIPAFLVAHGYGPDGTKSPVTVLEKHKKRSGRGR
jgi:hypothetical protein